MQKAKHYEKKKKRKDCECVCECAKVVNVKRAQMLCKEADKARRRVRERKKEKRRKEKNEANWFETRCEIEIKNGNVP